MKDKSRGEEGCGKVVGEEPNDARNGLWWSQAVTLLVLPTAVDFIVFLAEKLRYKQTYSSCVRRTAAK